jgi:hypothetical protein
VPTVPLKVDQVYFFSSFLPFLASDGSTCFSSLIKTIPFFTRAFSSGQKISFKVFKYVQPNQDTLMNKETFCEAFNGV